MHRFYVPGLSQAEGSIYITGDDVNHITNVLRMNVGDEITVSDGSSRDYLCKIASLSDKDSSGQVAVCADIIDVFDSNAELPVKVYLFQGVPKGDKLELIIQKCVELGVFEIVPVMMERTIVKLDEKKQGKKLQRYNTISESAAKQSRRGVIPEVSEYMSMKQAIQYASENMDMILLPYESAEGMEYSRKIISDIVDRKPQTIGIFIGPEGGFADSEVKALESVGAKIMSLGHRILRTETAGLAIMSILSFYLDNDNWFVS